MNTESDIRAIEELRAMARVYSNHGFADKAEQLTKLADSMEERMQRTIDAASQRVVQLEDYRADHDVAVGEEEG